MTTLTQARTCSGCGAPLDELDDERLPPAAPTESVAIGAGALAGWWCRYCRELARLQAQPRRPKRWWQR